MASASRYIDSARVFAQIVEHIGHIAQRIRDVGVFGTKEMFPRCKRLLMQFRRLLVFPKRPVNLANRAAEFRPTAGWLVSSLPKRSAVLSRISCNNLVSRPKATEGPTPSSMSSRNFATCSLSTAAVTAFCSLASARVRASSACRRNWTSFASACWASSRNRLCPRSARVARTACHVLTTAPATSSSTTVVAIAKPSLCRRMNLLVR